MLYFCFWAADPKGTMSYRTEVRLSEPASELLSGPSRVQPPRPSSGPSPLVPGLQDPLPPSGLSPLREPLPPTDGRKFPPLFYRTSSPSGLLPCLNFSILKKGPGPVMVSSTLCPAAHILGSQNVYSRAEGIADHYWQGCTAVGDSRASPTTKVVFFTT